MKSINLFSFKKILFCLFLLLIVFLVSNFYDKNYLAKEIKIITKAPLYNSSIVKKEQGLEVIYGELTGYGPDCVGCSGKTASGYDVRNGNIYYNDKDFGKVRILAAPSTIPRYSIIRVTAKNVYDYSFLAIVLDKGGKVKNNIFDLLFETEKETISKVGRKKNVKFEILRYGP